MAFSSGKQSYLYEYIKKCGSNGMPIAGVSSVYLNSKLGNQSLKQLVANKMVFEANGRFFHLKSDADNYLKMMEAGK